jgi:hypothetical protein
MSTDTQHQLENLRSNLTAKLGELHRRAVHAKRTLSPATYLDQPWVRYGVAAAIGLAAGYVLGGRKSSAAGTVSDGIVHGIVRAALSAGAAALVSRALHPDSDEPA